MNLDDYTLEELKALAYDLIVQQSRSEQQIEAVQQEIQERQQDVDVEMEEDSDEEAEE